MCVCMHYVCVRGGGEGEGVLEAYLNSKLHAH